MNINDVLVVPKQPLRTNLYADRNGCLETMYLGGNNSTAYWRVYDKAREVKAKGGTFQGECTRLERTARYSIPVKALPEISNPFLALQVCVFGEKPEVVPVHEWRLFRLASRAVGVNGALASLLKPQRKIYRDSFAKSSVGWWNPEHIWGSWLPHLMEHGILTELHEDPVQGHPSSDLAAGPI